MKLLLASLALVTFSFFTPNLHADPIVSLQTGAKTDTLIETPVLGGEAYTYINVATDIFQTTTQTFVATFTDLASVNLLTVTDVCANVDILAPAQPCGALAFSFADLGLGDASVLSALGLLGANINGDAVGLNFAASIGGGSATIGFANPPSPTPEPGSLGLLGTGVLGVAGVMRKRFHLS